MKNYLLRQLAKKPRYVFAVLLLQVFSLSVLYAQAEPSKKVDAISEVRINLNINGAKIVEIFNLIESKTDYTFVYDDRAIDKNQRITINKNNTSIYDILSAISAETDLKFKQINEIINVAKKSWHEKSKVEVQGGQTNQVTVTGRVTSDENEPIPGVNVVIKGTTIGTITDLQGDYSLEVPRDAVLIFSFIGFERQEVSVAGRLNIDVLLLSDITSINEVIVVGAAIKERDLTGAIVNVNEETLRERPVTSVNEALQGRAAGVYIKSNPQPGSDASIKVRGNNSMNYGASPIYVVDGIVMDRDFNMINLSDVASINVLKDASSTALYGSRGANGVVIITTKKGKSGAGKVTYDGWFGVQEVTNESLTLGAKDMFELRIDALENAGSVGGAYYTLNPNATKQDFINDELLADGKLWFADYEIESYNNGESYNWLDEITRAAFQQNHNLSFSGGSDKGNYYLSFGYSDQEGIVKSSNYKKYSGRINVEQYLKSWLKVGTNTSFTRSIEDLVDERAFFTARAEANPLLPISDEYLYLAWGNNWDINMENPLRTLKIAKDRFNNRVSSSNYLELSPVKGLNVRTSFALDLINQEYYEYTPSDIQQALRDSYRGKAIHNLEYVANYQWDNSVTYDRRFDNHFVTALFSTNMSKNQLKYTNVLARDFPTDDFGYFNLGAAYDKENFNLESDITTSTLMSYLGRLNYNFEGKYYATLTARYDGSSKFAKGYKWGLFPSISLAWNIANENFMKNQQLIDLAKIRLGYGNVGNQNIPDYSIYSLYSPSYSNGSVSYISTGVRGTNNLRWEKQAQFNVGLDINFFNNKLQATAEYFHIVNSNLLMNRSLSVTTGYSSTIENIGEMTNKGAELTLTGLILNKKDYSWNVSVNISSDKNEITKLYGNVDAIYNYNGSEIQREGNFFLGESLNSIYTLRFDRIIQESDMNYVNSLITPGKTLRPGDILPKDQQAEGEEGHGIIDQNDYVVVGKKDPKFYGGFSSKLNWKGLSLNAIFTYTSGAKAISEFYERTMTGTGYTGAHKDMLNSWTPTNTKTNIPRATYESSIHYKTNETSWSIQDASFLRLATLTLAYDFSSQLTQRLGINNLRVYTTGNNLFCLTKYNGYDPENGDEYPTPRLFVFGINLSF